MPPDVPGDPAVAEDHGADGGGEDDVEQDAVEGSEHREAAVVLEGARDPRDVVGRRDGLQAGQHGAGTRHHGRHHHRHRQGHPHPSGRGGEGGGGGGSSARGTQPSAHRPHPVHGHGQQHEARGQHEEAHGGPGQPAGPGLAVGVLEADLQQLGRQRAGDGQQVHHAHGQDEGANGRAGFEPRVVHGEHQAVARQARGGEEDEVDHCRGQGGHELPVLLLQERVCCVVAHDVIGEWDVIGGVCTERASHVLLVMAG